MIRKKKPATIFFIEMSRDLIILLCRFDTEYANTKLDY